MSVSDRDFREYEKLKNRVKEKILFDRLRKRMDDEELEKFFKPVVTPLKEQQKTLKEAIEPLIHQQKSIRDVVEEKIIPKLGEIASPPPLAIEDVPRTNLGDLASKYLKIYHDNSFGLYSEENLFKIGNSIVDFDYDDIIIQNKTYKGTRGLWELITKTSPGKYTEDDLRKYKEILIKTNAIWQGNDPSYSGRPKSSKGEKYRNIIKPIYDNMGVRTGEGLGKRVVKSNLIKTFNNNPIDYRYWDDPNQLVDRLRKIIASEAAGNNNFGNEKVEIIRELREAGIIE